MTTTGDWYTDIEEPSSGEYMKSKDLYNRVVLVRPTTWGEDTGDDGPYTFWNCDVVILNGAGIEAHGPDVRIGWKRIQKGLANRVGKWILAKVDQDGTAWVLDPKKVDPKIKAIVPGLKDEVEALFPGSPAAPVPTPPAHEDGTEPF
jgi:hypothetical protein